MGKAKIKYSKNYKSDFVEYVGLGSYFSESQEGLGLYYPKKNTKNEWNKFFIKQPEAVKFSAILSFWWNRKENLEYPKDLPKEYFDNFNLNFDLIEAVLKKYLVFSELPTVNFKYLDFIEGEQSFQKIIKEEEKDGDLICITLETSERILIKKNDELKQMFIPHKLYSKFKYDLSRLVNLIVGNMFSSKSKL
jgi:hypothetical protein